MKSGEIIDALKRENVPHELIAQALGRARPAATRLLGGQRTLKANEIEPLTILLKNWRNRTVHGDLAPDLPPIVVEENSYVSVDVLPTFAGMGGGGNGEGDVEHALVPRYLVEDVFRGRPADFVIVRTRGDSMEPDFFQDDELLCDMRDRSPAQAGPFALRNGDEYLIKNVEKRADGRVFMFSSNPKFPHVEPLDEQTQIVGRPVWCGRRL